jgi:hypothetical protein
MKKIIGAVGIRTIKAHRNCPHPGYSRFAVHVLLPRYLELNGSYIKNKCHVSRGINGQFYAILSIVELKWATSRVEKRLRVCSYRHL